MSSSKHTKIKERIALADKIKSSGIEMLPCARCDKRALPCLVSGDSSRCSECVRAGQKCDISGPSVADWERLRKEEERLEREQELAEQAILQAHQAAIAALARSQRLKKQRALLKQRGSEMIRRGAATLDELDDLEAKEKENAELLTHAQSVPLPASASEVAVDPSFLSDSFWGDLDFAGGTPAVSQDSF